MHSLNLNYNLMGFDTIEINLVRALNREKIYSPMSPNISRLYVPSQICCQLSPNMEIISKYP